MNTPARVGVLGGGLIGMSWAALFLARGCSVVVVDPRAQTGAELEQFVTAAWPHLQALGLVANGAGQTAQVSTDMAALAGVAFIQENTPDRLEIKQAVLEELEPVIDPQTIIASSSSSLKPSDIQARARHPARILVGHPMNPPHLVPMVELVAGRATSEPVMDQAEAFYRQMHRVPIRVKKEVAGHLANRLTAALYREAVHLVAEGIADVGDIDRAISYGPGMRWALMGPHLTYHLGGGAGGYQHYLDHLGPTQEARWQQLGDPVLDDRVKADLVAGVNAELAQTDSATLVARRDAALVELAGLKKKFAL